MTEGEEGALRRWVEALQEKRSKEGTVAEVTSENFAEWLLRSAEQAAAIKRGERAPARVSRHEITAREAEVAPPPRCEGTGDASGDSVGS